MLSTLLKLQVYMKERKILLPGALFLSALSSLAGIVPYIFIWLIVREFFEDSSGIPQEKIENYAWWAMGTAVVGVLLYFAALSLSHLAAFRVETRMRAEAMKKIVRFPLGFFDKNTSGRIRKIIDENAGITHSFLAHQMPDLAGTILVPAAVLLLILMFDWQLGLVCLIPILLSMGVMSFMMGGSGKKFMKMYMDSLEKMNTEAVEYVRGIPVVKVFQQTVFSFKNFYNSIMCYKEMVTRYTNSWEKPMSAYTVIINGIVFFLVPAGLIIINKSGNYSSVVLNLFLYVLLTPVFSQCIMRSMYLNQAMGQAGESIKRMEDLISAKSLIEPDCPEKLDRYDIQFEQVSFRYPGTKQKAIDNISFNVPEGKKIALVGASGSGKTTIARLIPRFWDVENGHVCIGGKDVRKIDSLDLMHNISFVFQNSRLFKTTILENVRYGKPEAKREEIESALDAAQCRDIIDRLPLGIETRIGAEGTWLSGGEQQRIVLARAILKDAPIIVLDEATAFADPDNEHLIRLALGKLTRGKTLVMIAHRLTSVQDSDTIIVIDKGRIAEHGSHQELINKKGIYSRMWREYKKSVQWTIKKEIIK